MRALTILLPLTLCVCLAQGPIDVPGKSVNLMEALQATLAKNPSIKLQESQVDFNLGALLITSGQFDLTLSASGSQSYVDTPLSMIQELQASGAGVITASQNTNTTTFTSSAQQEFRNGITVGPSAQLTRTRDNLADSMGSDTANLSFQVVVPLLRGRGTAVVAAQENAALKTMDASIFDLNQTVSQLLASTAVQYWNTVAAARDVEIALDSEHRGKAYAEDVQRMINADRVPRAEINQLVANLAERESNRIAAEQNLLIMRQSLAVAMGLSATELLQFPTPVDPLPDWLSESAPIVSAPVMQQFVDQALARRADLMALQQRELAAGALLPLARNQLRPQLDLSGSVGYNGLFEGTNLLRLLESPYKNVDGPSASVGVRYTFPPARTAARGSLAEANASYRQASLQKEDSARNIASSVVTSMVNLSDSILRFQRARAAVKAYQLALKGEQEKFRLGLASLVDVLTTEDRLTNAFSTENSAHLSYAVAVENLRFATGTLLDPHDRSHTIDRSVFVTPPFDWEHR